MLVYMWEVYSASHLIYLTLNTLRGGMGQLSYLIIKVVGQVKQQAQ